MNKNEIYNLKAKTLEPDHELLRPFLDKTTTSANYSKFHFASLMNTKKTQTNVKQENKKSIMIN
jgi:hypothetical protein